MNVAQKFGFTMGQASRLLVAAVAVLNVVRTFRPRQQRRRTVRGRLWPLAAAIVVLLGIALIPRLLSRFRGSEAPAYVPAPAPPEGVRDLEDGDEPVEAEAATIVAPFAASVEAPAARATAAGA